MQNACNSHLQELGGHHWYRLLCCRGHYSSLPLPAPPSPYDLGVMCTSMQHLCAVYEDTNEDYHRCNHVYVEFRLWYFFFWSLTFNFDCGSPYPYCFQPGVVSECFLTSTGYHTLECFLLSHGYHPLKAPHIILGLCQSPPASFAEWWVSASVWPSA